MGTGGEVRLQVLICTIGAGGIARVEAAEHPQTEGVEYVVSWQQPDGPRQPVPVSLAVRKDFRVVVNDTRGLSRNRNIAMGLVTAPWVLVGDDDVDYDSEGLRLLIERISDTEADVVCCRYTCGGRYIKTYGGREFDLRRPVKGWYPTSFEIAYRSDSAAGRTRFNENFGIGTPLLCAGEEDIWLYDSLKSGARGIFAPITIGSHDGATTAERHEGEAWLLMTHGAVLSYIKPWSWPARMLVYAWRKRASGFVRHLRLSLAGVVYARRNRLWG